MEFNRFEQEVKKLAQDALKDQTIHLRRALNGEISVVCGYVSPEYARPGEIISRNCFTVGQYKNHEIDLEEAFHYMMSDVNEQLEYLMMGE